MTHTNEEPDEDRDLLCAWCREPGGGHTAGCPEGQAETQLTNGPPDDLLRWTHMLTGIEHLLKQLEAAPLEVTDMPDAAGRLRSVERRMADLRHSWNEEQMIAAKDPESELGPGTFDPEPSPYGGTVHPKVVGSEYRTVTTRSCKRSFNTAPIIAGIADTQGCAPLDGLMFAIDNGLAKVTWKWTPLQKYAQTHGLPLRVVDHAVPDDGDLDGPWIGESWSESVKQEIIK